MKTALCTIAFKDRAFAEVLDLAVRAGFDGFLEVEFVREDDPEAALMADAAFLRTLCESTDSL